MTEEQLLQCIPSGRMFLWFWHIDIPGAVIIPHQDRQGGVPKTYKVPNKPCLGEGRKPEARSVMRLQPGGDD
jgi:hypothetical protein